MNSPNAAKPKRKKERGTKVEEEKTRGKMKTAPGTLAPPQNVAATSVFLNSGSISSSSSLWYFLSSLSMSVDSTSVPSRSTSPSRLVSLMISGLMANAPRGMREAESTTTDMTVNCRKIEMEKVKRDGYEGDRKSSMSA